MKKALGIGALAMVAALLPAVAGAQINANVPIISQGEFAELYVQNARLDPEAAWSADSAVDALMDLGIEPLNGWEPGADLTEGTMVLLLRFVDVPVFTAQPDRLVTVNEARAIFERFERLLIDHAPALTMVTGETATTIEGMDHPIIPLASP